MAKKRVSRKSGSKKNHDSDAFVKGRKMGSLGAVIPEMLSGLGAMGAADVVPPVVGGSGAVLSTVAATKWGGKISPKIPEMAPLAGAVGGALLSLPLLWWKDSQAAIQGMLTSGLVGLALWAVPRIQQQMLKGVVVRPYGQRMGLFEAQPVRGVLPQVTDSGATPYGVQQQLDPAVFGQVP
jgi:hypothetical protein